MKQTLKNILLIGVLSFFVMSKLQTSIAKKISKETKKLTEERKEDEEKLKELKLNLSGTNSGGFSYELNGYKTFKMTEDLGIKFQMNLKNPFPEDFGYFQRFWGAFFKEKKYKDGFWKMSNPKVINKFLVQNTPFKFKNLNFTLQGGRKGHFLSGCTTHMLGITVDDIDPILRGGSITVEGARVYHKSNKRTSTPKPAYEVFLKLKKKNLVQEGDSIALAIAGSSKDKDGESVYYSGYTDKAQWFLKYFAGVQLTYEQDEESLIKEIGVSCSPPNDPVHPTNSPSASVSLKFKGKRCSFLPSKEIMIDYLPKSLYECLGELDAISFSLTNNFTKKHDKKFLIIGGESVEDPTAPDADLVEKKFEHFQVGLDFAFKDVLGIEGSSFSISPFGECVRNVKNDYSYGFPCKLKMTFNLF